MQANAEIGLKYLIIGLANDEEKKVTPLFFAK